MELKVFICAVNKLFIGPKNSKNPVAYKWTFLDLVIFMRDSFTPNSNPPVESCFRPNDKRLRDTAKRRLGMKSWMLAWSERSLRPPLSQLRGQTLADLKDRWKVAEVSSSVKKALLLMAGRREIERERIQRWGSSGTREQRHTATLSRLNPRHVKSRFPWLALGPPAGKTLLRAPLPELRERLVSAAGAAQLCGSGSTTKLLST